MEPVYPASLTLADVFLNMRPLESSELTLLSLFSQDHKPGHTGTGEYLRWGSDPTGHLGTEQGQQSPINRGQGWPETTLPCCVAREHLACCPPGCQGWDDIWEKNLPAWLPRPGAPWAASALGPPRLQLLGAQSLLVYTTRP